MPVQHSPVLTRKKSSALPPGHAENREERRASDSSHPQLERSQVSEGGCEAATGGSGDRKLDQGTGEQVGEADTSTEECSNQGMEKANSMSKPIGKLDESVFQPFGGGSVGSVSSGSLSRSPSDTSCEGAICNGGPNKTCGIPVKADDLGVQCDMCDAWFHYACQNIPKPAQKAIDKYPAIITWLCPCCKPLLKGRKVITPSQLNESLDIKFGQLEKSLQLHIGLVSSSIETKEKLIEVPADKDLINVSPSQLRDSLDEKFRELDKTLQGHMELVSSSIQVQETKIEEQAAKFETSLRRYEKHASDQLKTIDQSIQQQKASYADAVKGSCNEVAKAVQSQIASLPTSFNEGNSKAVTDLSRALDDHLDRERRKANVVVHNLPEQEGGSLQERSDRDASLFSSMIKDVMKIHATPSRSFRVGKKQKDRPRLLIITLGNPAVKQDILRNAPLLRNSSGFGNIYLSPDLTQKEREASKKLREELASRKRAGETNIIIRGGRIVQVTARESSTRTPSSVPMGNGDEQSTRLPPRQAVGSKQDDGVSAKSLQRSGAPAILCSGGRGNPSHQGGSQGLPSQEENHLSGEKTSDDSPTNNVQDNGAPAILGSGGRGQPPRPQCLSTEIREGDTPTIPSGGIGGKPAQPQADRPTEPVQKTGAPAILCSGGRGQPTQQISGPSTCDVPPTVLGSGSGGQPDQAINDSPAVPIHENGDPAILSSGGGGPPSQHQRSGKGVGNVPPTVLTGGSGGKPAQPCSPLGDLMAGAPKQI